MNIALWIVAGLLALGALASGAKKLAQSKATLAATGWEWANDFSEGAIKTIGALEVLAAIGLILPAALHIVPVLVPLAAIGLALVMVGAMITHLRRHEREAIVINVVLLLVAAFVAWGRFGPQSFTS